MARLGSSRTVKDSEVTFSIELRTATSEQLEAGKRLFSRLLAKAKSSVEARKESKLVGCKRERARSAPGGAAKPPPASPPH